jgi:hypothetical protein
VFGEGHIATLMHYFAGVQVSLSEGRELEGRMTLEELLVKLEAPHVAATLGEGHFKSIYGGILFGLGTVYPYQFGDTTLQIVERMEKLGVRTWAMGADQIRLSHHAFRGETERVQYYRERVELYAVQGGTSWQTEVFWPVLLLAGDTLAGDTIAVRRAAEQPARRRRAGLERLRPGRACHLSVSTRQLGGGCVRLRGGPAEADAAQARGPGTASAPSSTACRPRSAA